MRKKHGAESCKAAERYSKAAAVLPPLTPMRGGCERGGEGEGAVGGVLPKRLKHGPSDHLPDVCVFL